MSQASSLSLPHAPPSHIHAHVYTGYTQAHGHTRKRSYTRIHVQPHAHVHSLTLSLRQHPARVSIHRTTREGVRVPGSSLTAAVRFQTPMRQPRTTRTHARMHTVLKRHEDETIETFPRLLIISAEKSTSWPLDSPPRDCVIDINTTSFSPFPAYYPSY